MTTPNQLVEQKLQHLEKTTPNFHRMSLRQLEQQTGIPEAMWSTYLAREEVRQRIHAKTTEDIEIAHRVAMNALALQAQNGNIQAIKELNVLSGILNQNNQKQIVTHFIPRPTQLKNETKTKNREDRIKEIMKEQDWSKEDAEEWYDYNEGEPSK